MTQVSLVDKNGNALRSTKQQALVVERRMPDFATLVNEGKVFECQDTTTTVALVARPDTTASLTMQNPASSGKTYVVFGLNMYVNVVPATLGLVTVWHCVHKLPAAALTRDLVLQGTGAGTATPYKGGTQYDGLAIIDRGATVIDDGWVPTPLSFVNNIATTNFAGNAARLMAPVILPPGMHYSLQTTATVVTFETALGFLWAELDVSDNDLEYV